MVVHYYRRYTLLLLSVVAFTTAASNTPNTTSPSPSNATTSPSPSPHSIIPSPVLDPHIYTVLSVSASLSLTGSLFIILSWLLFTDMHFFSRKLIVYIAATDLFSAAAFLYAGLFKTGLLHNQGDHATLECTIQGFTLQFFVLASYLWTACFAYHLHQLITKKRKKAHQLEIYYHAVSWGLPTIITIVLMVEKMTMDSDIIGGTDRPWCWLTTNHR